MVLCDCLLYLYRFHGHIIMFYMCILIWHYKTYVLCVSVDHLELIVYILMYTIFLNLNPWLFVSIHFQLYHQLQCLFQIGCVWSSIARRILHSNRQAHSDSNHGWIILQHSTIYNVQFLNISPIGNNNIWRNHCHYLCKTFFREIYVKFIISSRCMIWTRGFMKYLSRTRCLWIFIRFVYSLGIRN